MYSLSVNLSEEVEGLTNPINSTNIRNVIPRLIEKHILDVLDSLDKIVLVLGARQVGKTTLVQSIQKKLEQKGSKVVYLNCDIDEQRNAINTTSKTNLEHLLLNIEVLIIDEAQRLDNPGLTLKIIHDNFPRIKVLATGSSSFELKNKMSDPLTGRYVEFILYPLSFIEVLSVSESDITGGILQKNRADALLPQILLYGLYPNIYTESDPQNKQLFLETLQESYLFRDILSFERVRNSQAIKDLTKAVAYQIGSQVNENELANRLKIDRKTVVSYLDILEKSYVIVKIYPYSKNPRREIGRSYKIYFTDIGLRNALIGDFNPVAIRSDAGFLWENFLFLERMKAYANSQKRVSHYFWRSYSGAEVDCIEKDQMENLKAYEFKYQDKSLSKGAGSFSKQYGIKVKLINQENYLDFLDI